MTGRRRTREERWAQSLCQGMPERKYQPRFPPGWEHPQGKPGQGPQGDGLTGHYRCAGGDEDREALGR